MAKLKSIRSTRALDLSAVRKMLGLGQVKAIDVFAAAAIAMGVRCPKAKRQGYDLLRRFVESRQGVTAVVKRREPEWKPRQDRKPTDSDVNSDAFLRSFEWRKLRMVVLKKRGPRCECCGATPKDGIVIHVDHVKPRRLFPALALDESNLQILCEPCNHGKGSWDHTDWRESVEPSAEPSPVTVTICPPGSAIHDDDEKPQRGKRLRSALQAKSDQPRLVKRSRPFWAGHAGTC